MPDESPHIPARRHARTRGQSGFTIVEVLVAMILLATVASGIALAAYGTARSSNVTTANERELAAAKRVFEYLRQHRGWMSTCTAAQCPLSSIVPANLLRDRALDPACGGGNFSFRLESAWATPVDSSLDGRGTVDDDGTVPDYFTVHVGILPPTACDAKRLGLPAAPAVHEAAVDQRGTIPTGNLVVEVCTVRNQVDERMNIGGCRDPYLQMLERPCPRLPTSALIDNAARMCRTTTAERFLEDPPSGPYAPSLYSRIERSTASFTVTGPGGTRSSGSASNPAPGIYKFDDMPAGLYTITVTGIPNGQVMWPRKAAPSLVAGTTNRIRASVQPDVNSSALIVTRPPKVDTFNIRFTRRVDFYRSYKTVTPWQQIATKHPTEYYRGDVGAFLSWFEAQAYSGSFASINPVRAWMSGNCIYGFIEAAYRGGHYETRPNPAYPATSTEPTIEVFIEEIIRDDQTYEACTWYDFSVKLHYWNGSHTGQQTWNGAPVSTSYVNTPAPTMRDTNANGTQLESELTVTRAIGSNLSAAAATRSIEPMSTGLNTGLFSPQAKTTFTSNPDGNNYSVTSNMTYTNLPRGMYDAIWVRPDGSFQTPYASYPQGHTFTVKGRGECYWDSGGSRFMGPCSPCRPYIVGLGWYNYCYVLQRVDWKNRVFGTTTVPSGLVPFPTQRDNGTEDDTIKVCNSRPQYGTVQMVAPNCFEPPPPPPPVPNCGCSGTGSPGPSSGGRRVIPGRVYAGGNGSSTKTLDTQIAQT